MSKLFLISTTKDTKEELRKLWGELKEFMTAQLYFGGQLLGKRFLHKITVL